MERHLCLLCLGASLLLTLTGCHARWGMPVQGYGYPPGLAAFAPRAGGTANFTYYPRFEAYYHHATQQFYYPNGKKWEMRPALSGATPQFVFGEAGELATGMARVSGGKLQLKSSTTSLWHSIYATGSTPTWVISAGAA